MVIITFTVKIIIVLLIVFISIFLFCFILTKNKIKQNEIKWLLFLSCITFASAAIWTCFCKFFLGNFLLFLCQERKFLTCSYWILYWIFLLLFFSLGKILFICQWISNYFAVSFCFFAFKFHLRFQDKVVIMFILFIHVCILLSLC